MTTLEAPLTMARRTAPPSEFQKWLADALARNEIDLAELARRVGSDYSHLWKIARGDPSKYPTSRRPGYALTESIGVVLGDKNGALVAAGYWQTEGQEESADDSNTGQTVVLRPGVVAHLYSPSGETIEMTPRLLKILTAYAEPDTEELVGASGEQGKSESGEI